MLQDVRYREKLAHFNREVFPERCMHTKESGAFRKFTVTNYITKYTKAWNFREDDSDYYTQQGKLFHLINKNQQQVLFENTSRAMGDAPEFIKLRHIGNCLKADKAFGEGIAKALGLSTKDIK